jgi:hypothetical protein
MRSYEDWPTFRQRLYAGIGILSLSFLSAFGGGAACSKEITKPPAATIYVPEGYGNISDAEALKRHPVISQYSYLNGMTDRTNIIGPLNDDAREDMFIFGRNPIDPSSIYALFAISNDEREYSSNSISFYGEIRLLGDINKDGNAEFIAIDKLDKKAEIASVSGDRLSKIIFTESLPDEYLYMDPLSKRFRFVFTDEKGDGVWEIVRNDVKTAYWDGNAGKYIYK